jgi:hypothetical protein
MLKMGGFTIFLPSGTVGTVLFDIGDVFLASMIYLEGGVCMAEITVKQSTDRSDELKQ